MTIAHLCQPAAGERRAGDAVVVRHDADATLLAVIDVLGHGDEAAKVAGVAVQHLMAAPLGRATHLVGSLHETLRGSRGAAISLAVLRGHQIDACGVGNVEARVLGSVVPMVSTPGIVGQRYQSLRECTGKLRTGDRLVWHSDGISTRVQLSDFRHLTPRDACAAIMSNHRRDHDDATVLIADVGPLAAAVTPTGRTLR
ncbi:MAG TPA: hypothetical protein VM734_11625 [Kofleriaceae bacterium]|jgi:hypothetical protein|nr:hypothetical protein [Kofleriaceae bacterium]